MQCGYKRIHCHLEMKLILMKRNLYLLFFLSLLPTLRLSAQQVSGRVEDSGHQPLSYVTVRLLSADSTFVKGVRTDNVGTFSLHASHPGNYLLHVSCIGYQTAFLPVNLQNDMRLTAPIILQNNDFTLQEVTVKASSYVRSKDRLLIYPDKQQVKHSHTGYDLLYRLMIPGVDVDRLNGTVQAFGGEVSLYIDGRKASYREIQNLRPKDIEKVEYYDVPTGKYINDNAAVNFITRQYRTGGYVAMDAKQTIGYLKGDYNIAAKLAHGNTQYTLFAGYKMAKYEGDRENQNEHFVFSEHETDRSANTLASRIKNNQQYVQLNVENKSDKRSLLAKVSVVRDEAPDNYRHSMVRYRDTGNSQESFRNTDQSGLKPEVELYGYFHLPKDQYLETRLTGSYAKNKYRYEYNENSFSTLTHTQEDFYEFNADVSYGIQLKHQNSFTARLMHYHTVSSALYEGNTPSWQHLWMGRTSLLAEYSQKFGKRFSLKVVLGLPSYLYSLHNDDSEHYLLPYVNTRMLYRLADNQQFMVNVYWGNEAPSMETMSKAEQQIDSLRLKRSYPFEKLPNAYLVMAVYSGQFGRLGLQAAANYMGGTNLRIVDYYRENNLIVESLRNNGKAHNVNAELSASWKISDAFRVKGEGTWFYLRYQDTPYRLSSFSFKMQADYYWKDFSFGIYGRTRSKVMDSDLICVTTPAKYGISASWSYNGWYIEAGAENPFTKHCDYEYSLNADVYGYRKTLSSRINQQTGYIKVAYSLDFGKKTSRDSRDVNTNINSAILKAN